jgi:hypothetical protein
MAGVVRINTSWELIRKQMSMRHTSAHKDAARRRPRGTVAVRLELPAHNHRSCPRPLPSEKFPEFLIGLLHLIRCPILQFSYHRLLV